ncbi:MAG TPA: P63C domain-containing protein [Flavobacterium sp.]|jgi:hypothetical protein
MAEIDQKIEDKPVKAWFASSGMHLAVKDIHLPCYVLENGQRVFDKAGVQKAMHYTGKSKDWLNEFLENIDRYAKLPDELLESIAANPAFETSSGEIRFALQPQLLAESCRVIATAKDAGFLYLSEYKYAKAAATIYELLQSHDAVMLIDYASGYDAYKFNYKEALGRRLCETTGSFSGWMKSFPDAFFDMLFELTGRSWKDTAGMQEVADFIYNAVYLRLEPGLLGELNQGKPRMKYGKGYALTSYNEHPDLQAYLISLRKLHKDSGGNYSTFMQLIDRTYPIKRLRTNPGEAEAQPTGIGAFTDTLKKVISRK